MAPPFRVGILNQALEGTKQAAHLWQNLLTKVMTELGFVRSIADPNLFVLSTGSIYIIAVVWVDDIAFGFNDKPKFLEIAEQAKKTN